MQGTLGLARGSAGVQNEHRVLGIHGYGRAFVGFAANYLIIPNIARFGPGNLVSGMLNDHGFLHPGINQTLIGLFFQIHDFAPPEIPVASNQHLGAGILQTHLQRLGGKCRKHHRMHRADARASKHRNYHFGNHRQVHSHPIAFLDP